MADTVTSQLLENGPRNVVYKFTNFSDSTGESGVTKVNATSAGPLGVVVQGQTFYPGVHLSLQDIWWSVQGMTLRIQWHATANQDMLVLQGFGHWKFLNQRGGFGGIYVPTVLVGATGSIDFTTAGAAANSSYTILMTLNKGIPQV